MKKIVSLFLILASVSSFSSERTKCLTKALRATIEAETAKHDPFGLSEPVSIQLINTVEDGQIWEVQLASANDADEIIYTVKLSHNCEILKKPTRIREILLASL